MLYKTSELIGRTIQASDGDVGTIDDLYIDDERWGVRYFVVATGGWLSGKQVLLSPSTVTNGHGTADVVHVNLTRAQIENAPDVDTDKPVSRRYEIAHALHYGYPYYWNGPFLWGAGIYPGVIPLTDREALPREEAADTEEAARLEEEKAAKSHLRSVREIVGYHVEASDGTAGTVDDFVIDGTTWGIARLVVDARKWWPGGQVLIPPDAVIDIDWASRAMRLRISRAAVSDSPKP